jgi:hypothetical protein
MSLWIANGNGNGSFNFLVNFPAGVINRNSIVLANICEIARIPGEPNDLPWMGAASMEVRNIVPRDDGHVDFRIEIDWDGPLNFRMFIAVFD